jgi:hypothetical protein
MVDNIDKLYITAIKKYKKYIDFVQEKSRNYVINVTHENVTGGKLDVEVVKNKKTSTHKLLFFGTYKKSEGVFEWSNGVNSALLNHISDQGKNAFGPDRIVNKFFQNVVEISEDDHYVIPILVFLSNPKFNVIWFTNPDVDMIFYSMIDLGIKDNLNYNKFVRDIDEIKLMLSQHE